MPFTRTWNAAYEANPADSQAANLGATRIRELKTDIEERLTQDHVMDETADDGYHKQVTLEEQAAAPGNLANKLRLYALDVSGVTELYAIDSAGNAFQLTDAGKLFVLGTNNAWTKGQATTEVDVTFADPLTFDAALSNSFKCTLTANFTFNKPTNGKAGQVFSIRFIQDGTGSRVMTIGASQFKGNTSDDLVLSTGVGDIDLMTFYYDGTEYTILNLKKDIGNALP